MQCGVLEGLLKVKTINRINILQVNTFFSGLFLCILFSWLELLRPITYSEMLKLSVFQEREGRILEERRRRESRTSFAFGSSTPRTLHPNVHGSNTDIWSAVGGDR